MWKQIIEELNAGQVNIPENVTQLIHDANRIYTFGAGRSGLALKAFAMRLSQLELTSFVVGETTTPAIKAGDLLIVASASGTTSQVVNGAKVAKENGAKVLLFSTSTNNPLAELADQTVILPGKGKYATQSVVTNQPMGSLFEQEVWILGDAITMQYMQDYQISEDVMQATHANIE